MSTKRICIQTRPLHGAAVACVWLTIIEVRLWRVGFRVAALALRELKTAPCHTRRASLTAWLVTAVYAIAIGIASGKVATEHSILQPQLHGNVRRCDLCHSAAPPKKGYVVEDSSRQSCCLLRCNTATWLFPSGWHRNMASSEFAPLLEILEMQSWRCTYLL